MNTAIKKAFKAALGILVIGLVFGCVYLDRLMPIITGYAAKNLASAVMRTRP